MSCYKTLVLEIQELRQELMELPFLVRGMQAQFADKEWVSTAELELALDSKPFKLPWE